MRWPDLGAGEWGRRGRLAYLRPIRWVLWGVLAEESGEPDRIYVWSVAMPLTAPCAVLDLSWSDRVGRGSTRYLLGSPEAVEGLREAAARARHGHSSQEILLAPPGGADNVRMQEARAYGLLVSGDAASALEVLGRVQRYQPRFHWEQELQDRAKRIAGLVHSERVDEAVASIEGWRADVIRALRLRA